MEGKSPGEQQAETAVWWISRSEMHWNCLPKWVKIKCSWGWESFAVSALLIHLSMDYKRLMIGQITGIRLEIIRYYDTLEANKADQSVQKSRLVKSTKAIDKFLFSIRKINT